MNGCITTGHRAGYCPPSPPRGPSGPQGGWDDIFAPADAMLELFFLESAVDGIVIEPAAANDPNLACRCVPITKADGTVEDLCFKKGVIGTLTQEQNRQLCRSRIPLRHPAGFEQHIAAFERASEACVAEGQNTLEGRIACMSRKLREAAGPA
jgi:hypothetical protein